MSPNILLHDAVVSKRAKVCMPAILVLCVCVSAVSAIVPVLPRPAPVAGFAKGAKKGAETLLQEMCAEQTLAWCIRSSVSAVCPRAWASNTCRPSDVYVRVHVCTTACCRLVGGRNAVSLF